MSTIDQYKPCVCGSGKKFKFCRCGATDHVAELEKILKLIEGEQDLAALDRINKQLTKLPSAAWLLAIKAGLLLRMRETRGLVEIAQRFLKLKPDNPLALIYRSIATCLEQDSVQHQARYLLTGIAECRQVYPDVLGLAIELLTERILNSEFSPLIGVWGTIQDRLLETDQSGATAQAADVHLLCKLPNRIIESPEDAAWLERLAEVNALTSTFRFEQAEKKLISILRDFPNQPGPLSTLLRAQVALLDRQGAVATAKKLAENADLSPEDRAYFQVLAWEYDPTPLLSKGCLLFGAIESDEALLEALSGMPEMKLDDSDEIRDFMARMVGDEVPAKRVFHVYQSQRVQERELRSTAGILAIFGKQTDRPCRVFLSAFDYPPYRPLLEKVTSLVGSLQPIEPVPQTQQSYIEFLCRDSIFTDPHQPMEDLAELSSRRCEEFLNYPQSILEGQTPLEASSRPELQEKLRQLLLHMEGSPRVIMNTAALDEVSTRLGFKPRVRKALDKEDSPAETSLSTLEQLLQIDVSNLSDLQLVQTLSIVLMLGFPRLQWELAEIALSRPNVMKEERSELTVRSVLLGFLYNPQQRLEHSDRVVELLRSQNQPVGRAVMAHVSNLVAVGRDQEVQGYLMESIKKYPDDYELNVIMQQMMARVRADNSSQAPGGLPLQALSPQDRTEAGDSASSLVLPGDASTSSRESKLWLPGS
jgi:tetratricopeptide (TPR) repeat protein